MEAGKPISRAVYYCCRGYLLSVEGERYEWFYDDEEDRGRPDRLEIPFWERREKWVRRAWVTKWRANFLREWLDIANIPGRWWKTNEIAEGICHVAELSDEKYAWKPTPQNVSRHLHTYLQFYEKAFGMREKEFSAPWYKGRIFKFVSEEADPEYDAILKELANSHNWGRGKPVIRTTDGQWFRSMAEAEQITKIPYYRIYHCCEGDIDSYVVPLTGERMAFRYATEADRK